MRSDRYRNKTKHLPKPAKVILICAAALLAFCVVISLTMFRYSNPLAAHGLPYTFSHNGEPLEDIVQDGKKYAYNNDMLCILFIGNDATSQRPEGGTGDQADTLLLGAYNKKTGELQILNIPRDTITAIAHLDMNDAYAYTEPGPVSISRSFGKSSGISDDLTMATVSNLLYQIPVIRYVSLSIDGISVANDLVGGVRLEILSDFTMVNPEMKRGTIYTLTGSDAEEYTRARQLPGMDGSNTNRMVRQMQYGKEFFSIFQRKAKESPFFIFDFIKQMKGYLQSNLTFPEQIYLFFQLKGIHMDQLEISTIPGNAVEGENAAYVTNDEALTSLILNTFFMEIS